MLIAAVGASPTTSITPVPPATPIDRVNELVHVAWRTAMGVILHPEAADRTVLLAGAHAARAGVEMLSAVAPNRPDEGWLRRAARTIELGEANLRRCVGLLDAAPASGIDRAQLVAYAEQAEGDFDYAWELIANDS